MASKSHGLRSRLGRLSSKRNAFFRSIGFEFPFILSFSRQRVEEPKAIVRTSWKTSLARCGIHILPLLVSVTVLVLNLGNSYLGRGLPGSIIDPSINIALLQVAAKVQELLIVASMTTIVMHILRSELIYGEGLPLGLVGGGFLYTSLSYFWSPEFWGSVHSKTTPAARLRVYGIVVLGGIIATLAGPSTAVLLVPREQPWLAGGSSIYLPGSANTWWPSTVNRSERVSVGFCNSTQNSIDPICPGDMYSAVWAARDSIDILGRKAYIEGIPQTLTTGFSFGPSTIDVPSNLELLPNVRFHGNHRGFACETSAWGPRSAEAMVQAELKKHWIDEAFAIPYDILTFGASLCQYKYFGSMEVSTKTQIPAVRAACLPAQLLSDGNQPIAFPALPHDSCWSASNSVLVNLTEISKPASAQVRASWVSLPQHLGSVSAGLFVELPSATDDEARAVVACSVDARWANGTITTYHLEDASSLEKIAKQIVVSTARLRTPVPSSEWTPGYSDFEPVTARGASRMTTLDPLWLDTLTPIISPAASNLTLLEVVIATFTNDNADLANTPKSQAQVDTWNHDTLGKVNRSVALEWWLAVIVTDGLARLGGSEVLNTIGATTDWTLKNYIKSSNFRDRLFNNKQALLSPQSDASNTNAEWLQQRATITISGYSYKASSITDYAAATLLLTHIVIALLHIFYTVYWTKRSSSSWDSLTELMVLMQNSRPPIDDVLRNTGAGISTLMTYSRRARIFATRPAGNDGASESKVELIFEQGGVEVPRVGRDHDEHVVRNNDRRLESMSSITSRSPLLGDAIEGVPLHPQTWPTHSHDISNAHTALPRRRMFERVVPDVQYR